MFGKNQSYIFLFLFVLFISFSAIPAIAEEVPGSVEEYHPNTYGTVWSLLPPIIAIGLALITKEVYSSLFIGIAVGGLLYANFNPVNALEHIFVNGMIAQLSDSWNVGILVFLVSLGITVIMLNKGGGSEAVARWASIHIKSRIGAQLVAVALGIFIFIDDYFNCLTVGSVMLPVCNKYKISHEKLAYLIDSTAAPICIIAPVSSWAAAVTGFVDGVDGLDLFIRAIPYNFYALFTIAMVIAIILLKVDFGPMAAYEKKAENENIFMTGNNDDNNKDNDNDNNKMNKTGRKSTMIDLIFPIMCLIVFCVTGMIYTGGFFDGASFVEAFSNSDASVGLVYGSVVALILTMLYYIIRRTVPFKVCMESIPAGFKAMVPAILILAFAWTLKSMTDSLGSRIFVADFVQSYAGNIIVFLPAIVFITGCFLAFATGTSWGTFGILIPIVVSVFNGNIDDPLMIISISACMAGAVCGDHSSPISDTTIMASAGAQCTHISHVSTQIPYVLLIAAISFICYILAGFIHSAAIMLSIGIVLMLICLFALRRFYNGNKTRVTKSA